MPLISIIIPCYNHGQYIDDTLKSIAQINDKTPYEIIIVNDGSTDGHTNTHLKQLSTDYNVIVQENKGLSGARNTGIRKAKGTYILPLDADNKIKSGFIDTAVSMMGNDPTIDIVHTDATYFGERTGSFKSGTFNLQKLMLGNYIDACAIYRKAVWEKNSGYDEQMRSGWEDWEFWLNAAFKGARFYYVDKELFEYRLLSNSMARELNKQKIKVNDIIEYIKDKHPAYFGPQYIDENINSKFKSSPIGFISKLFLKTFMPAKFNKLVKEGRLRKYI